MCSLLCRLDGRRRLLYLLAVLAVAVCIAVAIGVGVGLGTGGGPQQISQVCFCSFST
jgi:hypothetical protein